MTTAHKTAAAATTVILLWASAFVGIRVVLKEITPGHLALARYAVAGVAFLGLLAVRRFPRPPLGDLARMAVCGGIGIALYTVLLNSGQRTVGAGVASLLVNTVPIWTALLSVAFLSERIGAWGWMGAGISFGGVTLISLDHGGLDSLGRASGGGAGLDNDTLLILGAAVSQALYFVLLKPLLKRYHPIDLTAFSVWFGVLFLLPFHDGLGASLQASSPSTQGAIVFLGIGPAALAYVAWSYVLKHLAAGRATALLYLVSVAAIALGWLVLGEWPSVFALVGGIIAILGVAISRLR